MSTSETIIYECAPLNPRPLADNFLRTGNPKSSFIKGSEDSWSVISVISTEMMRWLFKSRRSYVTCHDTRQTIISQVYFRGIAFNWYDLSALHGFLLNNRIVTDLLPHHKDYMILSAFPQWKQFSLINVLVTNHAQSPSHQFLPQLKIDNRTNPYNS